MILYPKREGGVNMALRKIVKIDQEKCDGCGLWPNVRSKPSANQTKISPSKRGPSRLVAKRRKQFKVRNCGDGRGKARRDRGG